MDDRFDFLESSGAPSTSTEVAAPQYIALATGLVDFPKNYSTINLATVTRALLSSTADNPNAWYPTPASLDDPPGRVTPEQCEFYTSLLTSFMTHDLAFWASSERLEHVIEHRVSLLGTLATSNQSLEVKRARALKEVIDRLEFFGGWEELIARGNSYQLGEEMPWHKPGEFAQVNAQFETNRGNEKRLRELGFTPIPRQVYLDLVRRPIMQLELRDGQRLQQVASIIALYTASRTERQRLAQLVEHIDTELYLKARTFFRQHTTAVPMQSLYSLAKEVRNISSFKDTLKISIMPQGNAARSEKTDGMAIFEDDDQGGQRVLFFDPKLVRRKNGEESIPDQFIEVPVDIEKTGPSVIDAIVQAIEQLPIDERLLEHLPRVTAAFFNAAQRDRRLEFNDAGTFWDTASGKRLSRLSGFDPDNHRHRAIVKEIRELLTKIILHREVRGHRDKTKARLKWRGPLLEMRASEIDLELEDREGITSHSTFKSWSIAKALWLMVVPSEEGGAPSFMSLDERAFYLDSSSSKPFNLYWTLVNRAYMNRLDRSGSLTVRVGTLYEWAGLQGRYTRPIRLRKVLYDALERMIEHDLLEQWSCPQLEEDGYILFNELLEATLRVTFSRTHLDALSHLLPH